MKILNKKARFNYDILDKLEVGIILSGSETKSAKLGQVSLKESYVKTLDNQLFLVNATITPYKFADNSEYEPNRSRKLLAHKKQIINFQQKIESSNLTIIPLAMYTKHRRVKLEIALARGKKQFEKKEAKKQRDLDRETQKIMKQYS